MGLNRGAPALRPAAMTEAAELLRSLASPQRLAIMALLLDGERAVSEVEAELGIRQPSLSQHLGSLREAGLIAGRREAKAVFYRVSDPRAAAVVEALQAIFVWEGRRRASAPRPASDRAPPRRPSKQPALARRGEAAVFARVGEGA